ncbi:MAG: gliding motility-associated C-terminal domain-containing protein [Bacteroidales bacterium]|nr:gliding motility-associated C-terminal domain-containing protein [Bacteroidales bacterium]
MNRTGQRNILVFFICLIQLALVPVKSLGSPQSISDVINIYGKVTAVNIDNVVLDDVTGFSVGDTTLLIQMKGGVIDTAVVLSSEFGSPVAYAGNTGQYEFIIIDNINGGTKNVTFRNNILGSYDPESFVQLVKVSSYIDVSVDATLTCEPWDSLSGTGGVLALISKRRVVLNADIDVSGKGFMGGDSSVVAGLCISVDPDRLNKLYFHRDSALAGFKGEGLASHIRVQIGPTIIEKLYTELYARGKKYIYTGGGGGNGRFSGGGGGAGYSDGGDGYKDDCGSFIAGNGGLEIDESPLSYEPVIMGGGGGASGYITGTGSDGGNGGGIVFILTDTIIGNGHSIIADGESVSLLATGEAGAGGGGAAGAIVISANQYASSALTLSVKGGDGGNTENIFGSGGGGGGGLVYASTDLSLEPTVSVLLTGGTPGMISFPTGTNPGSPGEQGEELDDLKMLLNGFLFNSIVSSVTSSLTDSICFGEIPPVIKGTGPVGGTPPYTYRWETSDDNLTWNLYPGSGSTRNLTPDTPETDTVWFRRVVTDVSAPVISDTSKQVIIMVQPLITGNLIGYDTIICAGQDPVPLVASNSGPGGGNSLFSYEWIDSTSVTDWFSSTGDNTGAAYDPASLTSTVYYKRVTTSGRCVDTSSYVTVSVLPLIADNTISADQLICEDHLLTDLAGSDPTGGDGAGTYLYEWISSTDGSSWNIAEGTIDMKDYDPDEDSPNFPGDQYYMRVVRSGYLDCCVDTSAQVLLTILSLISDNGITADQDICEGDVPVPFIGDDPGGGDSGTYTYIWEDSTSVSTWSLIAGADQRDYAPGALIDTTWYRRVVLSSACDDTSNVIVVNVHPAIINNSITTLGGDVDTIICSTAVPNQFKGSLPGGGIGAGTYLYEWKVSTDMVAWVTAAGTSDEVDYSAGSLSETSYFKRVVNSGECSTESNTIQVTVLPLLGNNTISSPQTICNNTIPSQLTGSLPTGGDNTYTYFWEESADNITWGPATEINNLQNYQPGSLTVPVYYRREVTSGLSDCCQDISSALLVGIYPLPTGVITAASDTSCAGEEVSVAITLTGVTPWDIVLNDGTNDHSFQAATSNYDYKDSPVSPVDYTYQFVSITDANGCVATSMTGSHEHKVFEIPVSDAGPDDETCGLDYTLTANPSVGSGIWISNEVALTAVADMTNSSNDVTVNTYGSYTFWWKETNWQCTDSASVDITFWEPPSLAEAGPDTALMPYTYEYLLEGVDPAVGVGKWLVIQSDGLPVFSDINSATALVTMLGDGENILKWIVENGTCPVEEDMLLINVKTIIVNSGFSPNGDGINDYFVIDGIDNTENELVITDMSGLIVYKITNYKNDWEGMDMYGNYLPDGTYYYFLKILSEPRENYKGYLIIKRNF